jgi:hypothetical protein
MLVIVLSVSFDEPSSLVGDGGVLVDVTVAPYTYSEE